MVFEFCNLVVKTYGPLYGLTFDDFSRDKKFTQALKMYMHQKEEIKDMLGSLNTAEAQRGRYEDRAVRKAANVQKSLG